MDHTFSRDRYDAIIVGSGPNGLAAAITLAREGLSVLVLEANHSVGGGTRSAELTRPGFVHDICSGVHPMAVASPFFRMLPLAKYGLEWVAPAAPLAHPLDDGTAVVLERSVGQTAAGLGADAAAYRRLIEPLAARAEDLFTDLLGPVRWPSHPFTALRFGRHAVRSARGLVDRWFQSESARALMAGLAGHAVLPLTQAPSAAVALIFAIAGHAVGWPFPRGGSQRLADALASYLRFLGGEICTGLEIRSVDDLPPARTVFLDVTPRQVLNLAGHRLPAGYRRTLARYRYGPGVFKLDWALAAPIPWQSAACARAGTVHVGGSFDDIAAAESAVWNGHLPERPFVLLGQPSLFDPTRAPAQGQTAWGYCHVPSRCTADMTDRIEAQIERFAPGFRACILARHVLAPTDLERYNANYVGGDIIGGVQDFRQLLARPALRFVPYSTPVPGIYICSASTPPGAGVHGLCGYFAARAALRQRFRH